MSTVTSRGGLAGSGVEEALSLFAPRVPAKGRLGQRAERHKLSCEAWLVDETRAAPVKCQPVDISRTGVYLTLALGPKVAVGQRYEVQLAKAGMLDHSPHRFEDNCRKATVSRVELLVGPTAERLGVALRFERPMQFTQANSLPH
jgi:hypothetical protein